MSVMRVSESEEYRETTVSDRRELEENGNSLVMLMCTPL